MQAMFKSIFTNGAKLQSQATLLHSDLVNGKFAPHEMPIVVMRLNNLYLILLQNNKRHEDGIEDVLKFYHMKVEYLAAVRQFIARLLSVPASTRFFTGSSLTKMKPVYPRYIQQLRNLFKDIDCQPHAINNTTDEYALQKFARIAAIIADKRQPGRQLTENMRNYYNRLWTEICVIKFAPPATLQSLTSAVMQPSQ